MAESPDRPAGPPQDAQGRRCAIDPGARGRQHPRGEPAADEAGAALPPIRHPSLLMPPGLTGSRFPGGVRPEELDPR